METHGFKNKVGQVLEGIASIGGGIGSRDLSGIAQRGILKAKTERRAMAADAAAIQGDWETVLGPKSTASPQEYAAALRAKAEHIAENEIKLRGE